MNSTDAQGQTPLHVACADGNLDMVNCILDQTGSNKADPNITNNDGFTPLCLASFEAMKSGKLVHLKICETLLAQASTEVTIASKSSNTPLHYLVQCGSKDAEFQAELVTIVGSVITRVRAFVKISYIPFLTCILHREAILTIKMSLERHPFMLHASEEGLTFCP